MSELNLPEPWDIAVETLGSEQVGWNDESAIVIRTPAELAEVLDAIAARRAEPAQATDAERANDEREALADLRKAVQDGAQDEWLLGFVRGYPFNNPAAQPPAQAASVSAGGLSGWMIEYDGELHIKQDGRTGIVPNPNSDSHAERILYALGRAISGSRAAANAGGLSDALELFKAWKGYPLPVLNNHGQFHQDWLHREFVAFQAGLARSAPAVGAGSLLPDARTLQFLTDVVTAAGLLRHSKTDKGLAERIGNGAYELRTALFADRAPASGAADLSTKQGKLLALADRIDHEKLWRLAGMDHDKLTDEQKDRMNAGVALRRYADFLQPGHWVISAPTGGIHFGASTLDKVFEMAKRDELRPTATSAAGQKGGL